MLYESSKDLAKAHLHGAALGFSAISLPMLGGKIWTTVKGEGKVHDLIPLATPGFRRQVVVGFAVGMVFLRGMLLLAKSVLPKLPEDREEHTWKQKIQFSSVILAAQVVGACIGIFAASYSGTTKGGLYKTVKWGCGVCVLGLLADALIAQARLAASASIKAMMRL